MCASGSLADPPPPRSLTGCHPHLPHVLLVLIASLSCSDRHQRFSVRQLLHSLPENADQRHALAYSHAHTALQRRGQTTPEGQQPLGALNAFV